MKSRFSKGNPIRIRSRSRSASKEHGSSEKDKETKGFLKYKIIKLDSDENYEVRKALDPRLEILKERNPEIFFNKHQLNRLFLVLDLDETLVNMSEKGKEILLFSRRDNNYQIKLEFRSHLIEFLNEMGKYFEIFIYSHGEKFYVEAAINKLREYNIPIRQEFFALNNDVFSPKASKAKKNLQKLYIKKNNSTYFSLEELLDRTIIIDDTFNVWEESHADNIIASKKFFPFQGSDQEREKTKSNFVLFSKFVGEKKKEVSLSDAIKSSYIERTANDDNKGQLYHIKIFLMRLAELHYLREKLKSFFNMNIRNVLSLERNSIMAGKNILLYELRSFQETTPNSKNKTSIGELIKLMGGRVFWDEYILNKKKIDAVVVYSVDFESEQVDKRKISRLEEFTKIFGLKLLQQSWVLDSYFFCTALPLLSEYCFKKD